MNIKELIDELEKYDKSMEVVTCDGYGSVDAILLVSVERVDDRNDILSSDSLGRDKFEPVLVLGWNQ
jgi:hypothetical protein